MEIPIGELICSICNELAIKPVKICPASHIYCGICLIQVNKCFRCDQDFSDYILPLNLEHLERPCTYWKNGCEQLVSTSGEHRSSSCEYRLINCFLKGQDDCSGDSLRLSDLLQHLKSIHSIPDIGKLDSSDPPGEFYLRGFLNRWEDAEPSKVTLVAMEFDGNIFLRHQIFERDFIYQWISVIGDESIAEKYRCKVYWNHLDHEPLPSPTPSELDSYEFINSKMTPRKMSVDSTGSVDIDIMNETIRHDDIVQRLEEMQIQVKGANVKLPSPTENNAEDDDNPAEPLSSAGDSSSSGYNPFRAHRHYVARHYGTTESIGEPSSRGSGKTSEASNKCLAFQWQLQVFSVYHCDFSKVKEVRERLIKRTWSQDIGEKRVAASIDWDSIRHFCHETKIVDATDKTKQTVYKYGWEDDFRICKHKNYRQRLWRRKFAFMDCKNLTLGCNKLVSSTAMHNHLTTYCGYRPIICPLGESCLGDNAGNCKFLLSDLWKHLSQAHAMSTVCQDNTNGGFQITNYFHGWDDNNKNSQQITRKNFDGNDFLVHIFCHGGIIYQWISVLGDEHIATKYRCVVKSPPNPASQTLFNYFSSFIVGSTPAFEWNLKVNPIHESSFSQINIVYNWPGERFKSAIKISSEALEPLCNPGIKSGKHFKYLWTDHFEIIKMDEI